MSKEAVFINLDGAPSKYRDYIKERNGKVATKLAEFLGTEYVGSLDDPVNRGYIVPAQSLTRAEGDRFNVIGPDDLYGAVFSHRGHSSKSMLHRTLPYGSSCAPDHYSPLFARNVDESGLVLPGFTVFEIDMADGAFNQLQGHHGDIRVKAACESDGNGQATVRDRKGLLDYLRKQFGELQIQREGIVLEPALYEPKTTSVGTVMVLGCEYSFMANQIDKLRGNGTREYRGADVTVARGSIDALFEVVASCDDRRSIDIARRFHDKMSYFGPIFSRISYDILSGLDSRGNFQIGVTDITARLGGTCPALMEAIGLIRSTGISIAQAQVRLNYGAGPTDMPTVESYENGARVYLDHDPVKGVTGVRITAKARGLS